MKQSKTLAFIKDLDSLSRLPKSAQWRGMVLEEYPFDHQLLSLSRVYRHSRKSYVGLGGVYSRKVSSTMRSLSAHDLFKDEIEYSPCLTEMMWFKDHADEVSDPDNEVDALTRFSDISLFHEQNHRIVWRLLPPAPSEAGSLSRYLNFAESLVATLDIVLADELGRKLSPTFERLKVIYRCGGQTPWSGNGTKAYRSYLMAFLYATYLTLELVHDDDILKATDYVFPKQSKMNRDAVQRALELSELFTRVTNTEWQKRNLESSGKKLAKLHRGSKVEALRLPRDPLDLDAEFEVAARVLGYFGV